MAYDRTRDIHDEIFELIPSQHLKPHFIDWTKASAQKSVDSAVDFVDYFNVDTAIGVQLDIIGEYVGESRRLPFKPETPGATTILDDDLYRLIILAKIAKNHWDGTIPSVKELWKNIIPGRTPIIIDHQDMSIDVYIYGTESDFERELVNKLYFVPKPEGVRVNYYFPPGVPLFGYDQDDEYIKGYDEGIWIDSV